MPLGHARAREFHDRLGRLSLIHHILEPMPGLALPIGDVWAIPDYNQIPSLDNHHPNQIPRGQTHFATAGYSMKYSDSTRRGGSIAWAIVLEMRKHRGWGRRIVLDTLEQLG